MLSANFTANSTHINRFGYSFRKWRIFLPTIPIKREQQLINIVIAMKTYIRN